ncbi:MAG: tyrosine-type recombinase/integrase [Erysipelotrichaceae bacterium]|nr:tyrosine-type recombinase/integrase [Erysipelotrichaceae bacterium]
MIPENEICQEWLNIKSKDIKPLTQERYENIINKYLLPFFEENPLYQLNEEIITEYLMNQYNESTLSGYSIKVIKVVLNSVCEYAHNEYGYQEIDFNKIQLDLDIEKKPLEVLSEEQESLLFQYCLLNINALSVSILLSLYAGLRGPEIMALQIKDVCLDDGYVEISKKYERHVSYRDDNTKNVTLTVDLQFPEKRRVILQLFMVDYLKSYIENSDLEFYLLSKSKSVPAKRTYQYKIKQLSEQLGIEISYSILRNTFKNNCIKNDIGVNTLMRMLGLSSMEIAMDDNYQEDMNNLRKEMFKIQPYPVFKYR